MRTTKTAKTVTTAFDVARYLRTPKERAEYLNARLEDAPEDVAGYASALGDVARAHGMAKVASDTGLSRESLYKALSQRGNPSLATVLKVWRALDLSVRIEVIRSASKAKKRRGAITKGGREPD